jgi:hypothetical protein
MTLFDKTHEVRRKFQSQKTRVTQVYVEGPCEVESVIQSDIGYHTDDYHAQAGTIFAELY